MKNMANFISYLRVSTQKQGYSGLGIGAQRAAVDQYLASIGGTLLKENVEVESGSIKNRPVLVQSIAYCRQTKATLVIAKLDRLARNVAFVSSLMEAGVEFVAVDNPHANRLMIHIMSAFAEHERLLISERTKSALAAARARGVQLGKNGRCLAESHKAAAMEFAESLRAPVTDAIDGGATTLQEIADQLNRGGHLTRAGAAWSPGTAQRLVRRLGLVPGELPRP